MPVLRDWLSMSWSLTVLPPVEENPLSAMTQDQCVDLVSTSQKAADEINLQMRIIAETMPEYKVLRSMAGVGDRRTDHSWRNR